MRWSTFQAWYDFFRHGRKRRDSEDFIMVSPRRITFEQKLASETAKDTKSPVESPVSAHFPGRDSMSPNDDRSGVRYSGASFGDDPIQQRIESTASEPHRGSMFMEHPHEFRQKQTFDRAQSLQPTSAEKDKELHM